MASVQDQIVEVATPSSTDTVNLLGLVGSGARPADDVGDKKGVDAGTVPAITCVGCRLG